MKLLVVLITCINLIKQNYPFVFIKDLHLYAEFRSIDVKLTQIVLLNLICIIFGISEQYFFFISLYWSGLEWLMIVLST